MKKFKKILCFVIPFAIVVAICLGVVLPLNMNVNDDTSLKRLVAEERASGSDASDSGASTADKSKKGGAIYLEPYATYTMSGGTISGSSNTYGGAIFISTGATFTMNGGTISGCSAEYGGGIYVSSGATLTIKAGTITGCTASKQGPAIYIEDGAIVDIDESANIEKNDIYQYSSWPSNWPSLGEEETVGLASSSLKLRTMTFGSYPQTYVGDSMNTTLEDWYSGKKVEKTYTIRDSQVWNAYEYTDGQLYARGPSIVDSDTTSCRYKNGTTIKSKGTYVWFKVEPIKWYILNYDAWQNGTEDIELLSELALTSYIRFNPSGVGNNWSGSELQEWLNGDFYKTAFDANEQEIIKESEVKNNVTGNYDSSTSDGTGTTTNDKIYCKSYWEMYNSSGVFKNTDANRYCSPSDFALSNNCYMLKSYSTSYRTGTCNWWLRSAGSSASTACGVYGNLFSDYVTLGYVGVRPALHLILNR